MDEKTNDLGYKNHDPFFYNLNKNFQDLMRIVSIARRDLTQLEELYVSIDTFYMFYSSYVENKKGDINKKLLKLKNYVYSPEYSTMLSKQKCTRAFLESSSTILLECLDIIPLIMGELHKNKLFPHLTEIDNSIPNIVRNMK